MFNILFDIEDIRSEQDFLRIFHSEEVCAEIMFRLKWPFGFHCQRCDNKFYSKINSRRLPLFQCTHCGFQNSLLTGTVMERSRTCLRKWFYSFYLVAQSEHSITAVTLQKKIKVTYKTAWLMLTKIRSVLSIQNNSKKLEGAIRINPAIYGERRRLVFPRHRLEQPLLVAASIDENNNPSFIKITQFSDRHLSGRTVSPLGVRDFISNHTNTGVTMIENQKVNSSKTKNLNAKSMRSYQRLDDFLQSKNIECITQPFSPKRCKKLTQLSLSAFRWINNKFYGVRKNHLQKYLDDYCFRVNCKLTDTSFFNTLINYCLTTPIGIDAS